MKWSRAPVDNLGSDSIQTTQRGQNGIDGVRQDIILVIAGEQPLYPNREVLRNTEISGTDKNVHPAGKNKKTGRAG
jgi:hypothetical protein